MAPAYGNLAGLHQRAAVQHQRLAAQARSGRHLATAAEPLRRGARAVRVSRAHRVLGVEHGEVSAPLRFEKPGLGGRVVLEGVVAVQVVGGHVQGQRDVRPELRHRLDLKTR